MKNYLLAVGVCLLALQASVFGANLAVNAGFETSETTSGGWPSSYDNWNGDYSAIVGTTSGVSPYDGSKMLQFKGTSFSGAGSSTTSTVFQLIDISAYTSLVASGKAIANVSTYFNRVTGDAQTDTVFDFDILAYNGSVSTFASRWEYGTYSSALATAYTDGLYTDSSVQTWEVLSASLVLPTNTTFLAIGVKASEDIYNDYSSTEFDGHFADAAYVEIVPEPASIFILGSGLVWLSRKRKV